MQKLILGLATLITTWALPAVERDIIIERCDAVWALTLAVGDSVFDADLCQGSTDGIMFFQNNDPPALPQVRYSQAPWRDGRLLLDIADTKGGPALYSGALDPTKPDWQALRAVAPAAQKVSARASIRPQATEATHIRIDASGSGDAILSALLAEVSIPIKQRLPLPERATFNFRAVPVGVVLTMLGETNGVALTWDASAALSLRRPRDTETLDALDSQISQIAPDADDSALAQHYRALHQLIKLRDASDLPPQQGSQTTASTLLHRYAKDYLEAQRSFDELIALRRDLLALALAYDARPDALAVAAARADLAYALQQANTDGEEDLQLLRAAEPVLVQHANALDRDDAVPRARALAQRGFERSAVAILEGAFVPCTLDDPMGWLFDQEALTFDLTLRYRAQDDRVGGARIMAQWQACIGGADTVITPSSTTVTANLRAGNLAQSANDFDLWIARLPPFSAVPSWALVTTLDRALLTHLALGNYATAADIFRLTVALANARGKSTDVDQVQAQLALLDALADVTPSSHGRDDSFWTQRYRSAEPLAADSADNASDGEFRSSIELTASVLLLQLQLPNYASGRDRIALHESAAVLGFCVMSVDPAKARADAKIQVDAAMALREKAGESAESLQTRRAQLEKLIAVAEKLGPHVGSAHPSSHSPHR